MDEVQHRRLASDLIAACGGVDAIVRAEICRVGSSQLYAFANLGSGQFMPADVMADLEGWHGEPIYSRAIFEARPTSARVADLITEACEATEAAAELQRACREAEGHHRGPTPRDRARIEKAAARLEEDLREVRAANATGGEARS